MYWKLSPIYCESIVKMFRDLPVPVKGDHG